MMTFDPRAVFVTGTGTEVGKTVVAAALVEGFAEMGAEPCYWKPVQTGGVDVDRGAIASLVTAPYSVQPTAHCYRLPASPDQAARHERREAPTVAALLSEAAALPRSGVSVIEGAGGLMVPLNDAAETWLDFLDQSGLATIVVASTQLGTLNHTSLTIHALTSRAIPIAAVILNGEPHAENLASLTRMHPSVTFLSFPQQTWPKDDKMWRDAARRLATGLSLAMARPKDTSWIEADQEHCWHPFTQHKTAAAPAAIRRAKGMWLTTVDGKRMLDATSSWWVNTIGHGRPEIGAALREQQAELDHVLFAGATHEPASRLAERVTDLTGGRLTRAFFTDNGSCAVEVGLKIALQSAANRGDTKRQKFLRFHGGYHGDTFGAMSVAASSGFYDVFAPLLFPTLALAPVTTHRSALCPDGEAGLERGMAELDHLFETDGAAMAGVIIEPLVQGSSGMNMQSVTWLRHLASLARRHGVPLILDEVFTGLGRIGAHFAFQRAGIEPDIVCLAKGLTGGSVPLALTLASERLFEAFLSDDKSKALLHGHSFTANPIGCRAALAQFTIYDRECLPERARRLEGRFHDWLATTGAELEVVGGRALGGIMAFELPGSGVGDYFSAMAGRVPAAAARHGLLLRPLGNTVYLVPPLSIADDELEFALSALAKTVKDVVHEGKR